MNMKELMCKTPEELAALEYQMALRENMAAATGISYVIQFAHKRVRVVKGRKVPVGTEGVVFWMGSTCHSKYGDPWGIYTSYRCGIRTDDGAVHFTAIDNIEVA